MSQPKLVLASTNQGKLAELRQLLDGQVPGLDVATEVVDSAAVNAPDVVEDGITFEANALKKAREIAAATGIPAVADDSGLAVDVLGGAPGIFSARWSGTHGDDQANLELLLAQLADIAPEHRGAGFVCAAAVARPASAAHPEAFEHVEIGQMRGVLTTAPSGDGGFGYDPILIPEGYEVTVAHLSPEEKNRISHRGQAFRALLPTLREVLAQA